MREVIIDTVYGDKAVTPILATAGAGGYDLYSANENLIVLQPGARGVIPTNLKMQIPQGYKLSIRGRSGLASLGLDVHHGTIDSDYRGEIGVIVINNSANDYIIEPNKRIAQAVLEEVITVKFNRVNKLSETERGIGGFGSTENIIQEDKEVT